MARLLNIDQQSAQSLPIVDESNCLVVETGVQCRTAKPFPFCDEEARMEPITVLEESLAGGRLLCFRTICDVGWRS